MELLDALGQMRVLRVTSQHSRLVQVLTAVLDAVDFYADLNSSFLKVGMSPNSDGFRSADLPIRTSEVGILLV